ALPREAVLQFRSAHAGDPHVEQDAARSGRLRQLLQQLLRRLVDRNVVAARPQQTTDRVSERCIVIDDMNEFRHADRPYCACTSGRLMRKTAPPLVWFSAQIRPP